MGELLLKEQKRKGNFLITYTGESFYPLDPRKEDYNLEDIAHALSMICRFGGHSEFHYSVAQHSLLCAVKAREVGESTLFQLWCLFHDASEAYLGDIPRPLKEMMPEYVEIESHVQAVAWSAFDIPEPDDRAWDYIKYYDNLALYNEIKVIKKNHPAWAEIMPEEFDEMPIYEMKIGMVKGMFITFANQLFQEYAQSIKVNK